MAGAIDNEYTYDADPPYVPALADLGGEDFEDDTENPPQKGIEPYAGLFSEHSRNLAGVNRIIPFCEIWVEWTGAEWTIVGLDTMGTNAKVEAADFTIDPTALGTATISWTAGVLPPMARKPIVRLTDDFGFQYGEVTDANEIAVYLRDASNVAANLNFVVAIK